MTRQLRGLFGQAGGTAMSEAIQVQMLGEFTIRYGDCVISDSNDRSHRVWSLLAYLLVNRRREFTQEELINLCWSGGTGSSDPANALKSVFHRIRALLDRLEDGLGHRLLLRRSGRYVWNEEIPITLDIEQFEERCRRGDREKEPEARLRAYQAAVGCYRGDLLPRLSGEIWVMPLETYYHGLYAGAVSSAIEILEDCGRTEELAALCRQAVKIEPYKEEFYEHLMCALIENGDNREAMAVYDDMSEMLFSDFGVMPGETLRKLYRQASRTVNDHTLSMDELRMQLQEENSAGGAMLCEYDFFKILYRTHGHRRAYLSAVGDGEGRFRPCAPQSGRRDGKAAAAAARQSAARRRYLAVQRVAVCHHAAAGELRKQLHGRGTADRRLLPPLSAFVRAPALHGAAAHSKRIKRKLSAVQVDAESFFYRFRFLKREYMDCAPYRAAAGLCWSTRSLTIMTVVGTLL